MAGTILKQSKTTSAPHMIGVAVIALSFFCAASNSAANPSSDYAGGNPTTAMSQGMADAPTRAENAGAMFMVGLVFGMVSGITLFFVHLRRREKRLARFSLDEMMLDNWPPATGAPSLSAPSSPTSPWDTEPNDEMIEKSDPWERSVDWWKNPDDQ